MQGPYRTTRSRDNVPSDDEWNRHLVAETAVLLQDALRWMRDKDLLGVDALNCLPLDSPYLDMCIPIFDATKDILSSEPALPRLDGGYTSAPRSRLGRAQELRRLFAPNQLAALYDCDHEVDWLSGDITQDREPRIRSYLIRELEIDEVDFLAMVRKLTRSFLESQSNQWILELYECLDVQRGRALRSQLDYVPIVRLHDGTHVTPSTNTGPQAFLPSDVATSFLTVATEVCASEAALSFLRSLGISEPDLVDDVIQNLLPKYQQPLVSISNADYVEHIGRILRAARA